MRKITLIVLKVLVRSYLEIKFIVFWVLRIILNKRYFLAIRNKQQFIKLIGSNLNSLEIGPFNKPLMVGENIKYFDVLDKDGLTARARQLRIDDINVPEIDFVSPNGDLKVINEQFDVVLSSHVIEHQPDLIYHLKCIENILSNNGRYFLIIPDKRFTFDNFIPESNLAQVITANVEQRKKHTLTSVIEHRCLTTHNNPYLHLIGINGKPLTSNSLRDAIAMAIDECNNTESYIDVHAWYFTPKGFAKLIQQLLDAKLIKLQVERVYDTMPGQLEFFVILSKVI